MDSSVTGYEPSIYGSTVKGCGSRGTSRVRLHPEDPNLLRTLSFCWTDGPGSIVIVIPSLELVAAEGRQEVAIWSGAELQQRLTSTAAAVSEARYLHRTKNTTINNYNYSYDERRTAAHN